MAQSIVQLARDLDLHVEREPRDTEQAAILFRILKAGKLLAHYWPISQTLELDGEERRMPDICAALKVLAPTELREAA